MVRPSRLTPFRGGFGDLYLLLGWVVYFLLYALTERLIPENRCHVIGCPLDESIPFLAGFAVFYVGWYGLILCSLGFFLLFRGDRFRQLQQQILLVQLVASALFILYPSCQQLRPASFAAHTPFTAVMGLIYRLDTPTGVFPSLHAAISLAIGAVWWREERIALWRRGGVVLFCLGVCLSVCFVKQHSLLDVLGAVPVWLVGEWFVFYRGRDGCNWAPCVVGYP